LEDILCLINFKKQKFGETTIIIFNSMCKLKFILRGYKLMNKMKIFLLGSLIISIFSLIAITAEAVSVTTWPVNSQSLSPQITFTTIGNDLVLGSLTYTYNGGTPSSNPPTKVDPNTPILANATFSQKSGSAETLNMTIGQVADSQSGTISPLGITIPGTDLASSTTLQVWISPNLAHNDPLLLTTGDYYLTQSNGLVAYTTGSVPTLTLSESGQSTSGSGSMSISSNTPYYVFYKFNVAANTYAEFQTILIPSTLYATGN
jgi:hypothetical protein